MSGRGRDDAELARLKAALKARIGGLAGYAGVGARRDAAGRAVVVAYVARGSAAEAETPELVEGAPVETVPTPPFEPL